MPRSTSLLLLACGLAVASCSTSSASSASGDSGSADPGPLPTIGIGSDVGGVQVTGGADVRTIGQTPIDTVVMIGDSITVASNVALETAFADMGFSNVILRAQEGKRMAQTIQNNTPGAMIASQLREDAANGADDAVLDDDHSNEIWVIALGTNDISQYDDVSALAAAVNEVLDGVPADVPLVWVDTYFGLRLDEAAQMNAVIESRLVARGNATIARWSSVADGEGVLRNDGVHPGEAGSEVFAAMVRSTIADFLQL